MYCNQCGNEIKKGQCFCTKCGNPIKDNQQTIKTDNETANGELNNTIKQKIYALLSGLKKEQVIGFLVSIIIIFIIASIMSVNRTTPYTVMTSSKVNKTIQIKEAKLNSGVAAVQERGQKVSVYVGVILYGDEVSQYILLAWNEYSNTYYFYHISSQGDIAEIRSYREKYSKTLSPEYALTFATQDYANGKEYGIFEYD